MTHTNGLMNAWEVWDPVVQCSVQAGRVLKGCELMQCGDMGRGVGGSKEIRECGGPVPKIRWVFFLLRYLIKILFLQIRSSSCSINMIQSKEKQREDGCLLISDR